MFTLRELMTTLEAGMTRPVPEVRRNTLEGLLRNIGQTVTVSGVTDFLMSGL